MPADEVFPETEVTEQFLHEREALIAGLLQALLRLSQSDRELHDRQIIGALANLARSYQTLIGSGLVYQEALPNPAQQAILETLRQLIQEFREVEQQHMGRTTLRDSEIFQTLVFLLRLANLHTSGRPRSRGFIDFLNARFAEMPDLARRRSRAARPHHPAVSTHWGSSAIADGTLLTAEFFGFRRDAGAIGFLHYACCSLAYFVRCGRQRWSH